MNGIMEIINEHLDEFELAVMSGENVGLIRNKIITAIQLLVIDDNSEDMVNSPNHYKLDGLGIESVEVIRSLLGKEKFIGWVWGNALKYLIRQDKKNGLEDLKKGRKNLDWMIEEMEKE